MKKITMSEKAYIIIGDLTNVRRAQDALRGICQPNSQDYITQEDYKKVMSILAEWANKIHNQIDCNSEN